MKLHYMGKYNLDPDSLPHGEHKPGAVKFKEPDSTGELSRIVSKYSLILLAVLMTALLYRYRSIPSEQWLIGFVLFLASLFPHELLHALCFRGDVYLYTNLLQGMLFVVGTEDMSKGRFVFMSLLPNIILGLFRSSLRWLCPTSAGSAFSAPFRSPPAPAISTTSKTP